MGTTRNCANCHTPLLPGQRADARFCSGRCRVAAHRDRSRDDQYTAQENALADQAYAALSAPAARPYDSDAFPLG